MMNPICAFASIAALACLQLLAIAQGTKTGNPEDQLPPNITQLTGFGERASWSPDGRRIAFMSRSFGDAFVVDVTTKVIRLLTHYPSAGTSACSTCRTATTF